MMLGLATFLVMFQVAGGLVFGDKSWQASLIGIVIQLLIIIFYPGFQAYLLKAVRKKTPAWGDFFWGWKYPVRIFVADILSSLPLLVTALTLGLLLMVVNALSVPDALVYFKYATLVVLGASLLWLLGYLSLGMNQWSLLLIDKNVSAFQSVKQSWELMRGYRMTFLFLWVIVALINCLGALALLVGVFVSLPMSLGTFAAFYVKISDATAGRPG
jgi:hypothetical protein